MDGVELRVRQRGRQVHAADLGADGGGQGADFDSHGLELPVGCTARSCVTVAADWRRGKSGRLATYGCLISDFG